MSAPATEAVEALPTDPTTTAPADTTAAAPGTCSTSCPCSAEVGHEFGGLPYILTVNMSVVGLPPMEVAEVHGTLGKVIAGPPITAGNGSEEHPFIEVDAIRSLQVVPPTYGDIYRAAAAKMLEVAPGLAVMAAEADAADQAEAAALAADLEVMPARCADGAEAQAGAGPVDLLEGVPGCCKSGKGVELVNVENAHGTPAG